MSYAGNPNGQNQRWSKWLFTIYETGRSVPRKDVEYNVARWLRAGFGSVGTVRLRRTATGWEIKAIVEGAPAHDPGYVAQVRREFHTRFIEKGWGPLAFGEVSATVLAGSKQDGKPAEQWVSIPTIRLGERG